MPLRTSAHLRGFDILTLACAHINDIRDAHVFDFAASVNRSCHDLGGSHGNPSLIFFGATYLPSANAAVALGYEHSWQGWGLPSGELIVIPSLDRPDDVRARPFEEGLMRRLSSQAEAPILLAALADGRLWTAPHHPLAGCLTALETPAPAETGPRPAERRHLYTPAFAERVATSLAGALDVGYGA